MILGAAAREKAQLGATMRGAVPLSAAAGGRDTWDHNNLLCQFQQLLNNNFHCWTSSSINWFQS
jgi:hypothetical protein